MSKHTASLLLNSATMTESALFGAYNLPSLYDPTCTGNRNLTACLHSTRTPTHCVFALITQTTSTKKVFY